MIDHNIVVRKLIARSVAHTLVIRWISSFLINRQQCVKFSEYISDCCFLRETCPKAHTLARWSFSIFINDLTAECLLHKFMDHTTLSEIIPKGGCSNMPNILCDVVKWSGDNQMNIYWGKTKEMLVGINSPNLLSGALCVIMWLSVCILPSYNWHCNSVWSETACTCWSNLC